MADSAEKPVIFTIHGSWHQPAHLAPLMEKLQDKGYEAVCYQNPTSDNPPGVKPEKEVGIPEDAAFAAKNLSALVEDQKKLVFVVCHSYGGMVCSQGVDEELSVAKRSQRGLRGGVVGLMYMCAFLVSKGEKVGDWSERKPTESNDWVMYDPEMNLAYVMDGGAHFYNDIEPEKRKHWAALLLGQNVGAAKFALTKAAYEHYPTTYLYADNDEAIPVKTQEAMVAAVKDRVTIREARCSAGHSPFLSQPDKLIEEILAAIQWSTAARRL